MKAWGVADVARRFGLEVVVRGADVSFPCPACGKARRHSKGADKRGAAKATPDGGGWWCEPCGAKGSALDIAVAVVTGSTAKLEGEAWAPVRRACADLGLCEADGPRSPGQAPYVPPAQPVAMDTAPSRLPAGEAATLWAACPRLWAVPEWELPDDAPLRWPAGLSDEDDSTAPDGPAGWCGEARRYLVSRGLDVGTLAALDVVRVLPPAERLASWPTWWKATRCRTWRLMVPMYSVRGELVAMQGLAIEPHRSTWCASIKADFDAAVRGGKADPKEPPDLPPKVLSSGGNSGTFFANAEGLELLRGTFDGPSGLFCEGLTDFLAATVATATLEPAQRPAVLGVISGSAREAASLKTTCRFVVMTDNDDTGEKYFEALTTATGLRGVRKRLRPIDGRQADVNDWWRRDPGGLLREMTTAGGTAHGA